MRLLIAALTAFVMQSCAGCQPAPVTVSQLQALDGVPSCAGWTATVVSQGGDGAHSLQITFSAPDGEAPLLIYEGQAWPLYLTQATQRALIDSPPSTVRVSKRGGAYCLAGDDTDSSPDYWPCIVDAHRAGVCLTP